MLLALRRLTTTVAAARGAADVVGASSGLSGLTLRPQTEYPDIVRQLVTLIAESPTTQKLAASLAQLDDRRGANMLMRHFTTQDDLGNAFRVLHVMKSMGLPRDRETYRYLMYACCKYADTDLALYAMENMLYDNKPDFASFKRLFDTCASGVDLRLWIAYDVMMWFYPLQGVPAAALRTTGYITELMKTIGLHASSRAGRGFITLPHHRGDPVDPFAGLFDAVDPNYPGEEEGSLLDATPLRTGFIEGAADAGTAGSDGRASAADVVAVGSSETRVALEVANDASRPREPSMVQRLRLIPEEFEDRNRLKAIVERNRRREQNLPTETHLVTLNSQDWSVDALRSVVSAERALERERSDKFEASLAAQREDEGRCTCGA